MPYKKMKKKNSNKSIYKKELQQKTQQAVWITKTNDPILKHITNSRAHNSKSVNKKKPPQKTNNTKRSWNADSEDK